MKTKILGKLPGILVTLAIFCGAVGIALPLGVSHAQGNDNSPVSLTINEAITVSDSVLQQVVNTPPVANNQSVTTYEATPINITLTAADADGNPLTYNVVDSPSHGSLSGTPPIVTYTPAPGYIPPGPNPDSFTFVANDGTVDSNVATVSITVFNVNQPPVLAPIGNRTVNAGQPLTFPISASDPDIEDIMLWFRAIDLPSGAILVYESNTSVRFNWVPGYDKSGTYGIKFWVFDRDPAGGTGLTDSEEITITVNPAVQAELRPKEYRWSLVHTPKYQWDPYPTLFNAWNQVRFENQGPGNAFNVKATITWAPPNVTIVDAVVSFGDIATGNSVWSTDDYALSTDMSKPSDPKLGIKWKIEYDDALGGHHIIENVPQ